MDPRLPLTSKAADPLATSSVQHAIPAATAKAAAFARARPYFIYFMLPPEDGAKKDAKQTSGI